MPLQTLSRVHAAHDINRGGHTVATYGCPGRIVDSHRSWADTTYTVEFAPHSKKHHRTGITLVGLTEGDVHQTPTTLVPERPPGMARRTAMVLGPAEVRGDAQISPLPEGAVDSVNDWPNYEQRQLLT